MKFLPKTRRAAFELLELRQLLSLPPVVANPIGDVALPQDASNTAINLAPVFSDPDGDPLSYLVTTATTVAEVVDQVSQADYTHIHQDLLYTHTGDNRGLGGSQHDLARNNIQAYFAGLGLSTALEPFVYSSTTYYNVVGTKLGATRPNDVYIVGAHYDSVNNPGADDNASGTAGVMEIARVLSNFQFDATLKFIAFDREEQGLKGSYAYVAAHPNEQTVGMVNLDMIAYNPAGANHDKVSLYDRIVGGSMKANLASAIATYAPGITSVDSGQIWGSDHSPFEERGGDYHDAALMIEYNHGTNPNYHQLTDAVETPGNIDYAFATQITRAATGYLAGAAGLRSTSTLLSADIAGGVLTLDYGVHQSGTVDVTVRASDPGGLRAYDTFRVTVRATEDLDADGNGVGDALSDGILILRYLFDPEGPWSVNDALGSGATRTTREDIKTYLDGERTTVLDPDGNGSADALSDGILILRYLFDPASHWNVQDALGAGATRTTWWEIKAYLDQYNPSPGPVAGLQESEFVQVAVPQPERSLPAQSQVVPAVSEAPALSDGSLVLRGLFDSTGQRNVADALGPGTTRTTQAEINSFLDQCRPAPAPSAVVESPQPRAVDSVVGKWPGGVAVSSKPGDDAEAEEGLSSERPRDWLLT